jgi:hypothetical protein
MTGESPEDGSDSEASSMPSTDGPPTEPTPQEAFSERVVGIGTGIVPCEECQRELSEGRAVIVYGYRLSNPRWWALARCYCEDCAPETLSSAKLGLDEALVEATLRPRVFLSTGQRRLCLADVAVQDASPETEGGTR